MFWSKIWFFLIALGAAAALTVALVLPRPAQRTFVAEEQNRLSVACGAIDISLLDDANKRVELASAFARAPEVVAALDSASAAPTLDEARMKTVRSSAEGVIKNIQGRKPDFAILIDRRGRAVARVNLDQNDFGDLVAGRPLVDDALAGYLRDDLWAQNNTMYFVSAAPVIKRDGGIAYVGAIVLGHHVTNELATKLVSSLDVDMGFYVGDTDVAGSKPLAADHAAMQSALAKLSDKDLKADCQKSAPISVRAGSDEYTAIVARLPGEAGTKQAYFSVMIKRPAELGFMGTIHALRQGDLGFGNFPWLLVGGGFLLALAIGIGLMFVEADRPLKRLAADAVRLAKGEIERLPEDAHGGKFGSIARSVNIAIDKLGRDAKTAKQDLDQLLGPAPEGSLGTIDLLASNLPAARTVSAPPPSEFRFGAGARPASAVAPPAPAFPTSAPAFPTPAPAFPTPAPMPPPLRAPTPEPAPSHASTQPLSLDDDILGHPEPEAAAPVGNPYFKQVYDQFISVKKSCGEPTSGLTLEKFTEKLIKNREDLKTKTGCREVRFTVYVKDGKAALKATPVKEE
ncbi:MAG TPA: MXAN_5187 family protein [Kofleriaceae bacterium]